MSTATSLLNIEFDTDAEGTLTPYALIKGVNKYLESVGVTKSLPTQMGYTYVTKGMVDGTKGTHKVTLEAALTWGTKYITKNHVQ